MNTLKNICQKYHINGDSINYIIIVKPVFRADYVKQLQKNIKSSWDIYSISINGLKCLFLKQIIRN